MTVVTTVTLKDETRNRWDRAMHERVRAASDMDGWVAVQLLREADDPRRRAIIGTWQSREHWAGWHDDETFKATRAELAVQHRLVRRGGGTGLRVGAATAARTFARTPAAEAPSARQLAAPR